jgi:hypothetical protein
MHIETTTMPTPEQVMAIEYRARQMRAEVVANGARAAGRFLRGLAARLFAGNPARA